MLILRSFSEDFSQTFHRFHDHTAGTCNIDPHKPCTLRSEHRALIKPDSCIFQDFRIQCFRRQSIFPKIRPKQIGSLRLDEMDFGQMLCQIITDVCNVSLQIYTRVYLQGNITYIRDYLAEHLPKVHLIEPEGTYLLWADFREYGLSAEALNAKILKDARIWFNEGSMFGPEGAGFMRINIASPRSMIVEAMERLGEVFGE